MVPKLHVSWLCLWRSATAGWVVTLLVLLGGVPLFLCLPPWNDVTLHDMAVRSLLRNGVHYRDVFDTNLPGIDWAMAGVRLTLGWSCEALRAVDLAVIAAAVGLLGGWVRLGGGTAATVAWLAAAAALFYPFTAEFNHVQRDPWLLLPAVVAARLRLQRVQTIGEASLLRSVVEGFMWGVAVWIKPHVLVPAGVVWIVSARLISRQQHRLRPMLGDLVALVGGGLLAGLAGVGWLVTTGAWPYFLDVFLNWNPDYLGNILDGAGFRLGRSLVCFAPWSYLHAVAVPVAGLALWEALAWPRHFTRLQRNLPRWLYAPAESAPIAAARAVLAALYLGWCTQGVLFQKAFDYVQVPMLLLAMAVVAQQRWAFGCGYLLGFVLVALLGQAGWVPVNRHPLTDPNVLEMWPRCWQDGSSPQLRNRLGHFTHTHWGTDWESLEAVASFLRTVQPPLGPGELNCWHDSTHPLYLLLDLDPATRYMHYGTVFGIRKQVPRIAAEVAASRQRYVVSDRLLMPAGNNDRTPLFPWNQPVVFESPRYLVHRVVNPLGVIDIPNPGSR
jgi:hypothetical protein